MPINEYSAETAFRNLRSGSAIWPSRGMDNRKGLVPVPNLKPKFQIKNEDQIFCLGSCFAQHVGMVLKQVGFTVPSDEPNPHTQGDWGGSNHLIRYNVFAMLNEYRWALDPSRSFPFEAFVDEPDGLFMDPHGHTFFAPHTKEVLTALRSFTLSVTKTLARCRIAIITLGLTEVWYDNKMGLYTNYQPTKLAIRNEPDRFTLRILQYNEILEALEEMYALLRTHGQPDFKILITTSPVPLHATFTGQDVFIANTYSKTVQRAALGEFVAGHDNVDYFPSYEAITLGNPDLVWKEDQRHVAELAVNSIMEHVLDCYAPQKKCPLQATEELKKLEQQLARFGTQLTLTNIINMIGELDRLRVEVKRTNARSTSAA